MNNRNSHNKAIIWTIASLLLWFFVAVVAKVQQFYAQEFGVLSELLNSPLGMIVDLLIMTMVIIPMLLRSHYLAKQAKMKALTVVLRVLMLLCAMVSLIFSVSLLI